MKGIKKIISPHCERVILLTVIILILVIIAEILMSLNTVEAVDVPGTTAYYDARWEEAKLKIGNIPAGTAYTDYQGNTATTVAEGPWMLDSLEAKVDAGTLSDPWNGTAVAPTETMHGGVYSATNPWKVYTAEEFCYCVMNANAFVLQKDMDLNGYGGKTLNSIVEFVVTYDGNGHTVYNGNTVNAIIGRAKSGAVVKDLRFMHSQSIGTGDEGTGVHSIVLASFSADFTMEKCAVEKCLLKANYGTSFFTGIQAQQFSISNCYVRGCAGYAYWFNPEWSCIASFACIPWGSYSFSDSFVTDTTIISASGHSGGFVTCAQNGGVKTYNRCFADVEMYGNRAAGVFCGGNENGIHNYYNCFAMGKVEGVTQLGGFASDNEVYAYGNQSAISNYYNCYSTAMVGMSSNATNAGGFFGNLKSHIHDRDGYTGSTFTNCYAAGEVGNIDTDPNMTTNTAQVGGFMGCKTDGDELAFTNCYYDKQTTAMREWETGWSKEGGTEDIAGIHGLLTTTTEKSGIGMTDRNWTALGDAYNNDLGDTYYPQLNVFSNPVTFTNYNWMTQEEMYNYVRACSKASVSTVQLKTWENDYAGTALPTTTYDTVRDVTIRFQLTSDSGISWERCGVTGSATLANGTGATSDAFVVEGTDAEKDVFILSDDNGVWSGCNPMPGVDWVRVTVTVGGQMANRALRICPRTGIEAGASRTVVSGEIYDHADDVQMVYSTGSRLTDGNATNDYTYGVFPDFPVYTRQQQLLNLSAFANYTALEAKYNSTGQNDAFTDIDAAYMERTGTALTEGVKPSVTASSNKINAVVIKQITGKNADGTFIYGDTVDLTQTDEANRWNGNAAFYTDDIHRMFEVGYYWSLSDGRYLYDSKIIEYPYDEDAQPPPTVIFYFTNEREDKPWANGKADITNDMPDLD